jgi:enamine deaminase RidA (YjgF/YER057c/UK114 family)
MPVVTRQVRSGQASETYHTCTGAQPRQLFQEAFQAAADTGRICRERIFVPAGQLAAWQQARAETYGPAADHIATTWLHAGDSPFAGGVQLHCISGVNDWTELCSDGQFAGWSFAQGDTRWAITKAITCTGAGDAPTQARAAFLAGEQILAQAGMGLHQVARTWIFMHDILAWYGELNHQRNQLFIERQLLRCGADAAASEVPASTGIGIGPIGSAKVSIEFFATSSPGLTRLAAAGKQRAAYEYGSAFARAATLPTPGGKTLFISGTAAIDPEGRTCHLGDASGQINMTMANIIAVAKQCGFPADSVVQAIAYCKTPAIAQEFAARQARWPWPWLIAVGDVCRDDLLFEAEITTTVGK